MVLVMTSERASPGVELGGAELVSELGFSSPLDTTGTFAHSCFHMFPGVLEVESII